MHLKLNLRFHLKLYLKLQANVDIFAKLVQDAMRRNAAEQRQKQQIKPQKRKPQQPRVANNRQKQQMDTFASLLNHSNSGNNQSFDQALLEIIAQGRPQFNCCKHF